MPRLKVSANGTRLHWAKPTLYQKQLAIDALTGGIATVDNKL